MRGRVPVGLLGATGTVGQQFVALLDRHPWFELTWMAAGERSRGRAYGELPWRLPAPCPDRAARLTLGGPVPGPAPEIVFSALDAAVAGEIETAFARAGHLVVTNARNHRMDPLVPLLVPEINPGHVQVIEAQRLARRWAGAIVANPNCSTVFLALVLAALRRFGPSRVVVSTLQALSGAGHPGVASFDAVANVIPFIAGEEEKIESETRKILGGLGPGGFAPASIAISAQATRVPVLDGHTELIACALDRPASETDVLSALTTFEGPPRVRALPSAPSRPLVYLTAPDRPQPRLDVAAHGGMAVHLGRLRPCPVLGWKLAALGHNTIRGAAGAAILNAELLVAEGTARDRPSGAHHPARPEQTVVRLR